MTNINDVFRSENVLKVLQEANKGRDELEEGGNHLAAAAQLFGAASIIIAVMGSPDSAREVVIVPLKGRELVGHLRKGGSVDTTITWSILRVHSRLEAETLAVLFGDERGLLPTLLQF